MHSSFIPQTSELSKDVERLWQLDVLPFRNEKEVTRSKEDQQAIDILESRTVRVQVEGVHRYATPLLRRTEFPQVKAPQEAVTDTHRKKLFYLSSPCNSTPDRKQGET